VISVSDPSAPIQLTRCGEDIVRQSVDGRFGAGGNNAGPEGAVEAVVGPRLEVSSDGADLRGVEGDIVGVAPHETDPAWIGTNLGLVAGEEDAAAFGAVAPMEDLESVEMAGGVDEREPFGEFVRGAGPKADDGVGALDPWSVSFVEMDRGVVEGAAPFDHRAVVVRVRDGDGGDTAESADGADGFFIEETDAIPEDVAVRRLDEERALADGELRLSADANEVWLLLKDDVFPWALAHFFERGPGLSVGADVLTFVEADGAGVGRER